MTNRERALNILRYKPVDRMPAVHFGYWKQLTQEWAQQGKIPQDIADYRGDGNEADRELDKLIGWDFCWGASYSPDIGLRPAFEHKILEILPDGAQRIQNADGLIERVKPGIASIPSEDSYQLQDRAAFDELYRPKMQYSPERVNLAALEKLKTEPQQDRPLGIFVGSILGKIRDMTSVVGMSYLIYDEDEELFRDIVDTYAEMQYQSVKTALESGVQFDFAHMWEDICFKNGPLVSPDLFEELCGKHYKKRCDLLHQYGIDIISLDCDGVTGKIQSTWIENGVNTLFPIEVGVWGDQFEPARNRFGKRQLGVGGMDKTALRKDKAAVDAELARMQHLADLGGFIPCPDHRLMPGTKFELVQYYAEEIKKIRV